MRRENCAKLGRVRKQKSRLDESEECTKPGEEKMRKVETESKRRRRGREAKDKDK